MFILLPSMDLQNSDIFRPNSSLICEDHGTCECGECKCSPIRYIGYDVQGSDARYSGTYCQCNDHNCDLHDTLLCGGK